MANGSDRARDVRGGRGEDAIECEQGMERHARGLPEESREARASVLELVGIAEPARNVRPYSTVWILKDLRDLYRTREAHEVRRRYRARS